MKQMRYWCRNMLELFHRYQDMIRSFLSCTSNIYLSVCMRVCLCGLFIFPSICKVLWLQIIPLKSTEDAVWYKERREKALNMAASFIWNLLSSRMCTVCMMHDSNINVNERSLMILIVKQQRRQKKWMREFIWSNYIFGCLILRTNIHPISTWHYDIMWHTC